jgi:hypothetical protein
VVPGVQERRRASLEEWDVRTPLRGAHNEAWGVGLRILLKPFGDEAERL